MRPLPLIAAFVLASPAAAQPAGFQERLRTEMQLNELRAQQQLLQQQQVSQHNELMALDARLRTEQQVGRVQAEREPVRLPQLPYPAPPGALDTSKLPAIPDAALAASNRRVQEILKNPN